MRIPTSEKSIGRRYDYVCIHCKVDSINITGKARVGFGIWNFLLVNFDNDLIAQSWTPVFESTKAAISIDLSNSSHIPSQCAVSIGA